MKELSEEEVYDDCLGQLQERHGSAKFYLVPLRMYVKALMTADKLLQEIADEEATIQHTNKLGAVNPASSPKVRMWALYSEQAMKWGKDLGLNLHQGKAGRPTKKKKDFRGGKMKIA